MTSRELIRWSARHERRARSWWTSPLAIAIVSGVALGVPVAWRLDNVGPVGASHAWLAGTIVAFGLAFMRVPFHIYWRADAALLAQLPIEGGALLDAALVRCVRAAAATWLATLIAAAPLLQLPWQLFVHHAAYAGILAIAAAGFLPAVAIWAASLVATGRHEGGARAINVATAFASGNPAAAARPNTAGSSGAVLGALPGFASTAVFVLVLIAKPWLLGEATAGKVAPELGGIVIASLVAIAAVRATAPRVMGTILRDVSALDRQRLATLEIRPPTAIERAVASLLGEAALAYKKDARLMRRRYPMAFALGALAFIVLVIVGLARPDDPAPWLVATLASAAVYALALVGRLRRPPIELPRLSATLPISAAARARAKATWITVWLLVFVAVPAAFALVRVR